MVAAATTAWPTCQRHREITLYQELFVAKFFSELSDTKVVCKVAVKAALGKDLVKLRPRKKLNNRLFNTYHMGQGDVWRHISKCTIWRDIGCTVTCTLPF